MGWIEYRIWEYIRTRIITAIEVRNAEIRTSKKNGRKGTGRIESNALDRKSSPIPDVKIVKQIIVFVKMKVTRDLFSIPKSLL
jgi:hypothetical protein